jgi:hypothetical protein
MVTFIARHRNYTFQHDNIRAHFARATSDFLQQNDMDVMPWSALSPCLHLTCNVLLTKVSQKTFVIFRNLFQMTFRYWLINLIVIKIKLVDTLIIYEVSFAVQYRYMFSTPVIWLMNVMMIRNLRSLILQPELLFIKHMFFFGYNLIL